MGRFRDGLVHPVAGTSATNDSAYWSPIGQSGSAPHVAFIGNSLPRRCGIATFTTDLQLAVDALSEVGKTSIVAMSDAGQAYDYPASVALEIADNLIDDYRDAAISLNKLKPDVISLQHEYGIFGGPAGSHVLTLLNEVEAPVVSTLHTILSEPDPDQRRVMDAICQRSQSLVVMSEYGRKILNATYDVDPARVSVIPHGIPDVAFVDPDTVKPRMGYADRTVILTFGLLSPNKGIEVMIDAMPQIIEACPDAIYVVLGATHPHLIRNEGEAYRQSLIDRAEKLGIADHVVFVDRFVDRDTLLDHIAMCDVYVTPYLSEAQMTSGTLAYSYGLGRPVVSTPYWHAAELLADGRGILVPFGDAEATGREVARLLSNRPRQLALRRRAYLDGRTMTWAQTARRYMQLFRAAANPPAVAAPGNGEAPHKQAA